MQAFNANRQLGIMEDAKAGSVEKLSSGYSVNRSADDAAGLSISEKMRKQIRGLTQACENVEDGISLCQVIDGAMSEMHDMVNRMNELCIQAVNGTNSESDRADIQMEIDGITSEFNRIIDTTKFNEVYVFRDDRKFRTGTEGVKTGGKTGGKSLGEVDGVTVWEGSQLSDTVYIGSGTSGWKLSATSLTARNRECAWVDFTDFKADSKDDLINQLVDRGFDSSCCFCDARFYGIKYVSELDSVGKYTSNGIDYNYHSTTRPHDVNQYKVQSEVVKIDLNSIWDKYENQSGNKTLGQVICESLYDVIASAGKLSGSNLTNHFTSYAYEEGTARLYLLNNQGAVSASSNRSTFSTMPRDDNGYIEKNEPVVEEPFKLDEKDMLKYRKQIVIQAGADAERGNKVRISLPTMTLTTLGLNKVKVLTEALATDSINLLTEAQKFISEDRSRIGAYQNRLEHANRNLQNVVENTNASESRIRDTDMADEMVRYAGNNILTQSGQSVLSQSNTRQQRVLSLLGV